MSKRVFFSFHYDDVINFRANVVRNHNVTKNDNGGFFDSSIWESSKKVGDASLKKLINDGLKNTSVTVVLIGSHTYSRRWVQYEIIKSIERGNRVIGIHINNIPGKDEKTKSSGPNPFDYLGLEVSADGTHGKPRVWNGKSWDYYPDLNAFEITTQPLGKRNRKFQLKTWLTTYDWIKDGGFNNFGNWVA